MADDKHPMLSIIMGKIAKKDEEAPDMEKDGEEMDLHKEGLRSAAEQMMEAVCEYIKAEQAKPESGSMLKEDAHSKAKEVFVDSFIEGLCNLLELYEEHEGEESPEEEKSEEDSGKEDESGMKY